MSLVKTETAYTEWEELTNVDTLYSDLFVDLYYRS